MSTSRERLGYTLRYEVLPIAVVLIVSFILIGILLWSIDKWELLTGGTVLSVMQNWRI